MIYQYVCPLCSFLFQVCKPYIHYKCPSCSVLVQAIEYKEEKSITALPGPGEVKNWGMN